MRKKSQPIDDTTDMISTQRTLALSLETDRPDIISNISVELCGRLPFLRSGFQVVDPHDTIPLVNPDHDCGLRSIIAVLGSQ